MVDGTTWSGRDISRSVFIFHAQSFEIYGSLYAASTTPSFGTVVCPAWGAEARTGEPLCRSLALAVARDGGAALVFDWPGQGESSGDPESIRLEDLVETTVAAVSEVMTHIDGDVSLAGLRLGSAIAALATDDVDATAIALMQPVLDPHEHFGDVKKASARASLGNRSSNGLAFGFSFPTLDSFRDAGGRVTEALRNFKGEVATFGYGSDSSTQLGKSVSFHGDWKQAAAARDDRLADSAAAWLGSKVGER